VPLVRDHGLEPASFGEAFGVIAEAAADGRVGIITGGRLTDEDAYALSKLARTVFRTNDLDHRRAPQDIGVDRAGALAAIDRERAVTYADIEHASTIVVVGLDAEQEVPILHLRLRKAARRGARIVVVHPRRTRLWDVAEHVLCRPGDEGRLLAGGADATVDDALDALRSGGGVVLAGERPSAAAAAMAAAEAAGARFAYVTRRAGDRSALAGGVHPQLGPGGRWVDDPAERGELERVWGPVAAERPGRATTEILHAAADGELDVLYLVGADILRDAPDAALARRALQNVRTVVVQSLDLGELEPYVSVFLPTASLYERHGHVSDWEGRSQRVRPLRLPPGIAQADWEIFAGLAAACGRDLGFDSLDELHEEMAGLWSPREAASLAAHPVSPAAGDALALLTYPLLIDEGRLTEDADELKQALEEPAFAELHPDDAASLGLADGVPVVLRTAAGAATLPLRVTTHIAPGTVFVPWNQPGCAANTLLMGALTADVAIEAAQPVAVAEEAS
jgi:NADH-quinone oxidoreductase subunit G